MSLNRILILTTVVLLMSVGVTGWYLWFTPNSTQSTEESSQKAELLDRAYRHLSSGDYEEALDEAIKLTGDVDPTVSIYAQRVVNEANFLTGSKESRVVAVQGAKNLFTRLEGYPEDQGLVIVSLLNYLSMAPESYIFDEIFNEGPFSTFLVKGSYIDSVKNLAEYSLSLKPTTAALARVGWWYADQILEVSRSYGLDATSKKEAADEILRILESRESLLSQEPAAGLSNDSLARANFYFWQASLYQAVARVYPEYIGEALRSLQALHNEYDATVSETGRGLSGVAVLIPYAELYYAQALYEVEGDTSMPQVREHLGTLIKTVEADPGMHRASFIGLIERQAAQAPQYQMFRQPTYARFIEEVPEFKVFLESYGWSRVAE